MTHQPQHPSPEHGHPPAGTDAGELGSITRSMEIEAPADVVYEVISSPAHLVKWWPDEAAVTPAAGESGTLTFEESNSCGTAETVSITVVEAQPHHRFAFRWVYDDAEDTSATPENSLLVVFEITATRDRRSTWLHMTESGFRDRGWNDARALQEHSEHSRGWDHHLSRLRAYAADLIATG